MDDQPRTLEYVPLDSIEVARWNPKDHDADLIAESVRVHGFVTPMVLDDRTGRLVAGHGRRDELLRSRAAGEDPPEGIVVDDDGRWLAPVVRGWRSRNNEQADRYVVVDNRAGEAGGWKPEQLAEKLGRWSDRGKLEGTGFTPRAAEDLLASLRPAPRQPDPIVPETPAVPITRRGDVWQLGPHRLVCGDSRSATAHELLMDGELADLVITSPPYNIDVAYEGHDDGMPWDEYVAMLREIVTACIADLAPGRAFVWNVGAAAGARPHRHAALLEDCGLQLLRQLVWRKVGVVVPCWHFTLDNPVVRQLTPNYQHELVYLFAKGELARSSQAATVDGVLEHDVFTINQATSTRDLLADTSKRGTGASNLDTRAQKEHPAPFPAALPRTFIGHLADPGAIVLDPFMGSGTTMIAAHQLGRRGYGLEANPGYCDVVCRRWQALTDVQPVRDGVPHDFTPAPSS